MYLSFTIKKVWFKGVYFSWTCFPDVYRHVKLHVVNGKGGSCANI